MFQEFKYSDLVYSITETIDLISPVIANHHKLVAYISHSLGKELNLPSSNQIELEIAGSLHDIGGITLVERLAPVEFEYSKKNMHPERGYLLLKGFKPLSNIATIIRYHHKSWMNGNCIGVNGQQVPYESHILNLADRVAVSVSNENENILNKVDSVTNKIKSFEGSVFHPQVLEAFLKLSSRESFWLQMRFLEVPNFLKTWNPESVTSNHFDNFIMLVSRIIDFKSRFTAAHSYTVAACAEYLAKLVGFSKGEQKMMRYAGYVHDLGKLSIPAEILEKPGRLSKDEFALMKSHTFHTNRVLANIEGFDLIRAWGAYHHEKLNGKGYPFGLKDNEIPLGSRILSVADIFTALREHRPYREELSKEETMDILVNMVENNEIDGMIVSIVEQNFEEVDKIRYEANKNAFCEYEKFNQEFEVNRNNIGTNFD